MTTKYFEIKINLKSKISLLDVYEKSLLMVKSFGKFCQNSYLVF